MTLHLALQNIPDSLVEQLRQRAESHHRSLEGEIVAVLEEALAQRGPLTPRQVFENVREMGLRTPAESAALIRTDRDSR